MWPCIPSIQARLRYSPGFKSILKQEVEVYNQPDHATCMCVVHRLVTTSLLPKTNGAEVHGWQPNSDKKVLAIMKMKDVKNGGGSSSPADKAGIVHLLGRKGWQQLYVKTATTCKSNACPAMREVAVPPRLTKGNAASDLIG